MNPTNISLTRRLPKEQYGFEEIAIHAMLEPGANLQDEICELRKEVSIAMGLSAPEAPVASAPAPDKPAPSTAKEEKLKKAKKEVAKAEPKEAPAPLKVVEPEPEAEETPEETTEEPPKAAAPAKEEKKKLKVKSSATKYDRNSDLHKKMFAENVEKIIPNWRATHAVKAKEASAKLEGKDFLDNEGLVLPSFKEEISMLMK